MFNDYILGLAVGPKLTVNLIIALVDPMPYYRVCASLFL